MFLVAEVLNSTQYLLSSQVQFYFDEIRDESLAIVMNKEIHLCCCPLFELFLFIICIFGRADSKIKSGVTYTTSVNIKMLGFKLPCVSFIQFALTQY